MFWDMTLLGASLINCFFLLPGPGGGSSVGAIVGGIVGGVIVALIIISVIGLVVSVVWWFVLIQMGKKGKIYTVHINSRFVVTKITRVYSQL